jgi:hypothetical protein
MMRAVGQFLSDFTAQHPTTHSSLSIDSDEVVRFDFTVYITAVEIIIVYAKSVPGNLTVGSCAL